MTTLALAPTLAEAKNLEEILAARGDSMAVCGVLSWLADLADLPSNAAPPLAMSGAHPRAVGSYGAECIAWAKSELGITLRWWQALAVTRQLEHDVDGRLVWREIVESGPRRIGKSVRLRVVALWRLAHAHRFNEPQLAMLVSKDLAVGKEIHRGAWRWAESKDWKVTRLNGGQEIETPAGDRWLLRAPNAAYGYDVGYGQVDESWDVDPQAITDGIEPALLERESPQLHLTSTAHVRASSLMRRRLTAALRDADQDILLLMWGARPGSDFADVATWRSSSPHWSEDRQALMGRKYAAALAGQDEPEFDDPDPVRGWASQYLNIWPLLLAGEGGKALPGWSKLVSKSAPASTPAALGIEADYDQVWLSLSAVMGDSVPRHLGSVHRIPATRRDFFVQEVRRIQAEHNVPVGIDRKGPASFLIDDLETAGVNLTFLSFDDVVQADAELASGVKLGTVEHGDYDELNRAVDAASWRGSGDRRVLGRKSGDISSLKAASIAHWIAKNEPTYDVLDSIA